MMPLAPGQLFLKSVKTETIAVDRPHGRMPIGDRE